MGNESEVEYSSCERSQWYALYGRELRSAGWKLRRSGPRWNATHALIERRIGLKACPLCAGEARDMGHGISCLKCGLWLGDGSQALALGGYMAVWNGTIKG